MKLYSGPLSLFSAKARVALDEKGLPYELVSVPFSRERGYDPKPAEVRALHPKAQVPILVDGDLAVYDSTLICEYLEDRYPEPALYPADAKERARCRRLESFADEIFFPHVWTLIQEVFYQPEEARRDAGRIAAAQEGLRAVYDQLDAELGGREFLCGGFGVADVANFLTLTFASRLGAAPEPGCAQLDAWLARTSARPSMAKELEGLRAAGERILESRSS